MPLEPEVAAHIAARHQQLLARLRGPLAAAGVGAPETAAALLEGTVRSAVEILRAGARLQDVLPSAVAYALGGLAALAARVEEQTRSAAHRWGAVRRR